MWIRKFLKEKDKYLKEIESTKMLPYAYVTYQYNKSECQLSDLGVTLIVKLISTTILDRRSFACYDWVLVHYLYLHGMCILYQHHHFVYTACSAGIETSICNKTQVIRSISSTVTTCGQPISTDH